ncbi:PilW family protein [Aphanothece sacrum]|uniref:Prepilin cleavage protein n=1 Tax=Aphanothece sacrum FPU1 TaxID=1920663 RepID=A0A401IDJ1_APHSA|nr:hypothetical protein [Aphanothece sacrum]GBF79358.1 prepilin cleavage protein [Aphanothece sacrum FPU1]GBF86859.1 prepilin cleavage protein [Aphanothece sacrum FPU3]
MKLLKLLSLIKKNRSNSGFGLAELLIAASLTSVVVSAAGFGLVNILAANNKASAKATIQYNSNRALEFMSDEVKPGIKVESDAVAALAEAPDFTLPNGAKPILVIQLANVPQRIIYYTKPATNPWIGPTVIERWGPALNEKGKYDSTEINNPQNWQSQVIIDQIDNKSITPNCSPNWQPTNPNPVQGFNACVDPTQKLVKINLATTVNNRTWRENVVYKVETLAFARAYITQNISQTVLGFNIVNNQLTVNQAANLKFEVLGGEITCGAGGVKIPVTTKLYMNGTQKTWNTDSPLNLPTQPAGTTFDVTSISGNGSICDGFSLTASSKDSNTPQVKVLVNGDPIPNIRPFANQNTIEFFLQKYIENGKIKIADNQVIYLFELGTTNQSSSAFDLQDNVVLATVNPVN